MVARLISRITEAAVLALEWWQCPRGHWNTTIERTCVTCSTQQ